MEPEETTDPVKKLRNPSSVQTIHTILRNGDGQEFTAVIFPKGMRSVTDSELTDVTRSQIRQKRLNLLDV